MVSHTNLKGGKKDNSEVDAASAIAETKDELTCCSTSFGSMVVNMCIGPAHIRHPSHKRVIRTRVLLDSCT